MTIRWSARPEGLERPALVAGFEGWNDAGNAASDALRWLVTALDATEFARLDPDEYVDFQAQRPRIELRNGVISSITWPETRCFVARPADGPDLVLVLGTEPNYAWRAYCADLLGIGAALGCDTALTLGALLADAPHSRPTAVTGTATDPATIERFGLVRSRYQGPTGIVGVLQDACREAGVPSISLWAPVPHYAASPPSPKATHALLERLGSTLALPLRLDTLGAAATAWEQEVDRLAADDDEVSRYVRELEARYDADRGPQADDDGAALSEEELPSGDVLAADIERFLREHGDDA